MNGMKGLTLVSAVVFGKFNCNIDNVINNISIKCYHSYTMLL